MPCALLPFSLLFFLPLLPSYSQATSPQPQFLGSIGAILDSSSRAGKEEKIAMEMAVEDFLHGTSDRLRMILHIAHSPHDPVLAASVVLTLSNLNIRNLTAAMNLINKKRVQVILGLQTWQEAAFVANLGHKALVPVLSFAASTPFPASHQWPFLIQVAQSRFAQMRAVAAIIGSWQWRRVTVIHENIDYVASGIIPRLAEYLHEVGSEIDYQLSLPPMASSLSDELEKLKIRRCRVFIVHASLELATRLFSEANLMGMMDADSVWITTDEVTSLLDYVNSSVISSMQGVLGVEGYFPHNSTRFYDFQFRFRRRFQLEYPEEENPEPGDFALRAYDAVWAVANALERVAANAEENHRSSNIPKEIEISTDPEVKLVVSANGQKLLETILLSDFQGLSSEFRFVGRQLIPPDVFQLVNVVGKSYRELGFWSQKSGFSDGKNKSSASMEILGQIYWPGGPWTVPRGWAPPTGARPLNIGVPAKSAFQEFVAVNYNEDQTFKNVTGFSIDVFKAVLGRLPYNLHYNFVPFHGSYDSLLQQVQHKAVDAVVGDTSIVANRYQYVEFSQPYAEPGLVMVVSVKSKKPHRAWLFMKPFSKTMWALTALINVYNGFVVWVIEPRLREEVRGSSWINQICTVLWFSFTTLFSLHREGLGSNLARMAMVVWLFVALILTQSYTANLSSMLTLRGLDLGVVDVNAAVGCDSGSFVVKYLEKVLGFPPNKIKQYNSGDDYPRALKDGEIAAALVRVPFAKVLLAKSCAELTTTGQTFDVGGFGFAFPKGSPLIPDVSKAILEAFESGKIHELERDMVSSYKCSSSASDGQKTDSLSFWSFAGLFGITGGTSTVALLIFVLRRNWQSMVSLLATAKQEVAQGLRSFVKHMKDARNRLCKKKKAADFIHKCHAHDTEMTNRHAHGEGSEQHCLDLEGSTQLRGEHTY